MRSEVMQRRSAAIRRSLLGLAVAAAAVASGAHPTGQTPSHSHADWGAPGGDWGMTRYSTLVQIDTKTVSRLAGAWSIELPPGQVSKAPLMVKDGRMFAVTSQGTIMALDPATGAAQWTYRPDTAFSGNRGIGIGNGLLFAGLRDSSVIAISQATGQLAWKFERPADLPSQGISSAPAYGNGVVVAGVSFGDNFMRGRAIGIDATSGKRLWTFEVVPGPGVKGHETWPQDSDVWKYGGGAIWTTPSVDEALNLVYLQTGNAVPQFGGEVRPGDNLYDNSVVALDLKTGQVRWHFQLVHHDIWEHDVSTPLVLYDTTIGGRRRQVLLAVRTDGVPFVLDRATGRPVLPVEERRVKQDAFLKTSPTQPFTTGADRLGPECVDQKMLPPGFTAGCYFDLIRADVPNLFLPHMNMRQTPMAYSPETNQIYASVCVNPAWVRRAESPWVFITPVRVPGQQQYGYMAALDSRTMKIVWQKRVAYAGCEGGGGATATAGGLVFHVEPDGEFQAYDAKNGSVLWRFQTGQVGLPGGAGPGGGPAISYEVAGTQYVALTMNRRLWAFKLGGSLGPASAPEPPPLVLPWSGRIDDAGLVQLGAVTVFNIQSAGRREEWRNDYGVSPSRTHVAPGAPLTFTNSTTMTHTMTARDGSWTSGPIAPGGKATVTVTKPGVYEYRCIEHPWSMGELTVGAP
jgi:PQQ-dependent dehydrogenase (methanol/ethanol family)